MEKRTKIFAILFVSLILLSGSYYAKCDSDQININTASKSELQDIDQVGEVYSERIIKLRPFKNLEGLKKVKGIAEGRLEDIKKQGLACVGNNSEKNAENETNKETENDKKNEDNKEVNDAEKEPESGDSEEEVNKKPIEIDLKQDKEEKEEFSKDIKKNENKDNNKFDKEKFAEYGIGIFCVAIASFYFLRRKRIYKNEFR